MQILVWSFYVKLQLTQSSFLNTLQSSVLAGTVFMLKLSHAHPMESRVETFNSALITQNVPDEDQKAFVEMS